MAITILDMMKIEAWLLPRIAKAAKSGGGSDPELVQRVEDIERVIPEDASTENLLATMEDVSAFTEYNLAADSVIGSWIDPDYPEPFPIYRKVVWVGQLPSASGNMTIPHNLPAGFKIVNMRGVASSTNQNLPIPSAATGASSGDNAIYLGIGPSNITIGVGKDRSSLTRCYVFIEYYLEPA